MEEDIDVSSEMAVHCVCRNVMSLLIIITITGFSQYVMSLCKCVQVTGNQQKGKKIGVYIIAC